MWRCHAQCLQAQTQKRCTPLHSPDHIWLPERLEVGFLDSGYWVLDSMYPVTRRSPWKDGKTDLGEQGLINATIIFFIKK